MLVRLDFTVRKKRGKIIDAILISESKVRKDGTKLFIQ